VRFKPLSPENVLTFQSPVLRTIFDHVFLQIDNLVGQQIEQVQEKKRKVKVKCTVMT
jgi:hypothetical protein